MRADRSNSLSSVAKSAIAIVAHPDDIEFLFAGTLLQLGKVGYALHYFCLANGGCGSLTMDAKATANVRRFEAKEAAKILGATWHGPSGCSCAPRG